MGVPIMVTPEQADKIGQISDFQHDKTDTAVYPSFSLKAILRKQLCLSYCDIQGAFDFLYGN